ncbi:jeltraxin-like [Heptranchias perlo]|uniref:jeltraxin-like n=1 Tax=Heptranchias perlo TaxID=212740 RepID=UPI0035594CD3
MKVFLLITFSCLITPPVTGEELQGLIEESLVFLSNSQTDHVVLIPRKEMNLKDLTLCLSFNSELVTRHILLSLQSSTPRELTLRREDKATMAVSISGMDLQFQLPDNLWSWVDICVTRDWKEGLVGLYVNGRPSSRKLLEKSKPVTVGGQMHLGRGAGSVEQGQNFVGEVNDVNLWDRILAPGAIRKLHSGASSPQGNVIGWLTAQVRTAGDVRVVKSTRIR